jgi:hypothetical protein
LVADLPAGLGHGLLPCIGSGCLVPDEGNLFVIPLWNRAGLYRSLGALVLVGGIAGGVAVAADGPARQPASANNAANSRPLNVADLERQDAERAEAERAARDTAQRKADEAAVAAAEQAKKSPSASASASGKSTGKPGVTAPPAPASCNVYSGNRKVGCSMVLAAGWDLQQMACLEKLWSRESGWNEKARNPSSGAYGIPQSLPANKMASAGGDYLTNPATQIKWGLGYIRDRYSNPCGAWNHSENHGWY